MSNGNIEANNISSEIIETRGIIVTDTGTFKNLLYLRVILKY